MRIVKLLVHVSEEEQKKRMIKRLEKPHKRYKVGLEDFRNIAKRKQYLEAYKDMLDKTDTDHAPWHVIASDDKRHARLRGLKIIVEEIGRGAKIIAQELDPAVAEPPSSCGAGRKRTAATRSDRGSCVRQASAGAVPGPAESEALDSLTELRRDPRQRLAHRLLERPRRIDHRQAARRELALRRGGQRSSSDSALQAASASMKPRPLPRP